MNESNRQSFIKGYKAGWEQCLGFVDRLCPNVSGEAVDRIRKSMEITERTFIPKPYKDSEITQGRNAYSEEGLTESES